MTIVAEEDQIKDIGAYVAEHAGIVKVSLAQLRDELGFARLGKKVLNSMSEHLREEGLGYFPGGTLDPAVNPVPRQWQEIWVYERDGSAKSAVLDAVADPNTYDLVEALTMFSEGAPDFTSMNDSQRLAFVRAAVCNVK